MNTLTPRVQAMEDLFLPDLDRPLQYVGLAKPLPETPNHQIKLCEGDKFVVIRERSSFQVELLRTFELIEFKVTGGVVHWLLQSDLGEFVTGSTAAPAKPYPGIRMKPVIPIVLRPCGVSFRVAFEVSSCERDIRAITAGYFRCLMG